MTHSFKYCSYLSEYFPLQLTTLRKLKSNYLRSIFFSIFYPPTPYNYSTRDIRKKWSFSWRFSRRWETPKNIFLERMNRIIHGLSLKMILDNLENRYKWKMQFYFHQKIKRNLLIYFKWIHMNHLWHRYCIIFFIGHFTGFRRFYQNEKITF